jgi:hypothetical protein
LVLLVLFVLVVVANQCSHEDSPAATSVAEHVDATPPVTPAEQRTKWLAEFEKKETSDAAKVNLAESIVRSDPNSPEAKRVQPQLAELKVKAETAAKEARERGAWDYEIDEEPLAKGKVKRARVLSENTFSFGFPYEGEQHAMLTIRNHPRYGKDVILQIEKGQIVCSTYSCPIAVVFDDGTPMRFEGNEPEDNSSETVFIPAYSTFMKRLGSAKTVRIGFTVFQQGSQVVEFKVKGFDGSKLK